MVDFLGWLNFTLLLGLALLMPLKMLAADQRAIRPFYNTAGRTHPWIGCLLIISGLMHGYLALGGLRPHTGLVLVTVVTLNGAVAAFGPQIKGIRPCWRRLHRGLGLLALGALVIHLFWRGLI